MNGIKVDKLYHTLIFMDFFNLLDFHLVTDVDKWINNECLAPHYIRNMLKHFMSSVNLPSSSKGLLSVPHVRLVNYGE